MGISYANKSVGKQMVSHNPKRNKLNSTSHGNNTDDKFSTTVQSAKATGCWNLEEKSNGWINHSNGWKNHSTGTPVNDLNDGSTSIVLKRTDDYLSKSEVTKESFKNGYTSLALTLVENQFILRMKQSLKSSIVVLPSMINP